MVTKVDFKPGRFSLVRIRDGAGDCGPMLLSLGPNVDPIQNSIEVGRAVRVGSIYARTFTAQDWWQTTIITKIHSVEYNEDGDPYKVVFDTGNSTYELKVI